MDARVLNAFFSGERAYFLIYILKLDVMKKGDALGFGVESRLAYSWGKS